MSSDVAMRLGDAFVHAAEPMYAWQGRSRDDLRLVALNAAAEQVPHSGGSAHLGQGVDAVLGPSPDEVSAGLVRCAADRVPVTLDVEHVFAASGRRRRLLVSYAPVPDDLVLITVRDVHEDWARCRENERRAAELEQLTLLTHALLEPETPQDVRDAFCEAALALAGADAVYLTEPRGDELWQTARAVQSPAAEHTAIRIPLHGDAHSLTREVFRSGERVFVPDCDDDPRADAHLAQATGISSGFFEPIVVRGTVIGVLVVGWRFPMPACPEQVLRMMPTLAAHAGMAFCRADQIAHLEEQATRDPLTGLPNRRTVDLELERHFSHARRTGRPLSVAVLDLDDLKSVNDSRGHQAGDDLLRTAAEAWRSALRREDQLARVGGDEFVVLMPDTDEAEARRAVERLRASAPEISVAVGVAQLSGSLEAADLLAAADRGMYEDKSSRR